LLNPAVLIINLAIYVLTNSPTVSGDQQGGVAPYLAIIPILRKT
jgi:hypothetical protein